MLFVDPHVLAFFFAPHNASWHRVYLFERRALIPACLLCQYFMNRTVSSTQVSRLQFPSLTGGGFRKAFR